LFDDIADVVIFDVDVLRLRGDHVVGSKGNATLVVLNGGGWVNNGKTKRRKKLPKKHGFLRIRCKGQVFGLGGRESNAFFESSAPRNMTTRHHSDKASAGAAINTIGKGRVLPNKRLDRDKTGEG
jgi:hypothetical protein